jgi:hypothetical protein
MSARSLGWLLGLSTMPTTSFLHKAQSSKVVGYGQEGVAGYLSSLLQM